MSDGGAKRLQVELYEAGEYSGLSAVLRPAAVALVEAAGVGAGARVLDVAAGDGNVALAAARRGADVTATDISAVQVQRGAARSAAAGLAIRWQPADAEGLPFGEDVFDHVLSAFGVVAAPDPEMAVAELFRVCRPGGTVALTTWPHGSYMTELARALRDAVPIGTFPDPDLGWDDESVVRERLERHAADVRLERRPLDWDPAVRGIAGAADCAAAYFLAAVPGDRLAALGRARAEVEAGFRREDGHIDAEYLLAVADKLGRARPAALPSGTS